VRERGDLKGWLAFGLVASLIFNAVVLLDDYRLRLSKDELEEGYTSLENSFDELKASLDELNSTYCELNSTYRELGINYSNLEFKYSDLEGSYLGLFDDPLSPPVSKLQAIDITLEHGGWNSSNLRGKVITAGLWYRGFWAEDVSVVRVELPHKVEEPVSDYSPVVEGDVTYRYVWHVVVEKAGSVRSIDPPGLYYVDAATGEIVFSIPH
jgi:hypothetical protein